MLEYSNIGHDCAVHRDILQRLKLVPIRETKGVTYYRSSISKVDLASNSIASQEGVS